MKLAVIAANGQAGKAIVEEAVKRGHEVTVLFVLKTKVKLSLLLKKIYLS